MGCQVTFQTTLDRSFVWFYLGLNQFSTTTFYYLFILQSSVFVCLSVAFPSLLFPFFFFLLLFMAFYLFFRPICVNRSPFLSLHLSLSLLSRAASFFSLAEFLKAAGFFFQWGRLGKKKSDCQIEVMPKTWVKKEQKIELMMTTTTGTFTYSGVSLSPHLTLQ